MRQIVVKYIGANNLSEQLLGLNLGSIPRAIGIGLCANCGLSPGSAGKIIPAVRTCWGAGVLLYVLCTYLLGCWSYAVHATYVCRMLVLSHLISYQKSHALMVGTVSK